MSCKQCVARHADVDTCRQAETGQLLVHFRHVIGRNIVAYAETEFLSVHAGVGVVVCKVRHLIGVLGNYNAVLLHNQVVVHAVADHGHVKGAACVHFGVADVVVVAV